MCGNSLTCKFYLPSRFLFRKLFQFLSEFLIYPTLPTFDYTVCELIKTIYLFQSITNNVAVYKLLKFDRFLEFLIEYIKIKIILYQQPNFYIYNIVSDVNKLFQLKIRVQQNLFKPVASS